MPKFFPFALLVLATVLPAAAADAQRPKILGVAHIGLAVSDMEKSRAFYRDFLGYQEPYSLRNPDGSLFMTFFKINDRQYIELFPGLKPGEDRLRHIALYTDDAEAMRRYLAAKGLQVPDRVPKGRIGNANFTVKDPEGIGVEFVQYEPDGWSLREQGKFLGEERISNRLLHVGVIVGSLQGAMGFYRDILGLQEFWRGASRGGNQLSWVNLRVPDGTDYVEFMLYDALPDGDHRGSQHHLCLEVPDASQTVARLEKRAYRKGYDRPIEVRTGVNRRRQVNLFDPDGTRTEVMEPKTVDGNPAPSSPYPPPRP